MANQSRFQTYSILSNIIVFAGWHISQITNSKCIIYIMFIIACYWTNLAIVTVSIQNMLEMQSEGYCPILVIFNIYWELILTW